MIRPAMRSIPPLMLVLMGAASTSAQGVTEQGARAIAKEAYVYGYPMMLTHITLQKLSNFRRAC